MNYRVYNILCACVFHFFCLLCKIFQFFFPPLFLKTGKEKCAESARRFRPLKNPIFLIILLYFQFKDIRPGLVCTKVQKKKKIFNFFPAEKSLPVYNHQSTPVSNSIFFLFYFLN